MAGCGAYGKIEGFALMPSGSFTMALSTFVSQNIGARKFERARKGAGMGLLMSMGIVQLTGILIYFCAPYLIRRLLIQSGGGVLWDLDGKKRITGIFYAGLFPWNGRCTKGVGLSWDSMIIMITLWCGLRVAWILTAIHFSGISGLCSGHIP